MPQKKDGTPQLNQVFKNTETPQKFCGNTSKILGNPSKILGNFSIFLPEIAEMPQKKTVFEGLPLFLRHFRVETFPCWGVSIAPDWDQDISLDQSRPSELLRLRISELNNSFNNKITLLSLLNPNCPGHIVKKLNLYSGNLGSSIISRLSELHNF